MRDNQLQYSQTEESKCSGSFLFPCFAQEHVGATLTDAAKPYLTSQAVTILSVIPVSHPQPVCNSQVSASWPGFKNICLPLW